MKIKNINNGNCFSKVNSKYSMVSIKKDFIRNRGIYFFFLPVFIWFIVFCYIPMAGLIIGFLDYSPAVGVLNSRWVGLKYFKDFFGSPYAFKVIKNTFLLSFYDLIWGFPMPIILAMLLNEVELPLFKRTIQTVSYIPYFVSVVVICGIIRKFVEPDGLINMVISMLGGSKENLLLKPQYFRTIFITSNIWQGVGWNSIVYLAALAGINPSLYEAATIDGANRFKQAIHVTLPGILPTIIIMLIMRVGSLMAVSADKVILLYNPLTYDVADVVGSFIYRKGLTEYNYSYSTAVGMFNSVVNLVFVLAVNKICSRVSEVSLW